MTCSSGDTADFEHNDRRACGTQRLYLTTQTIQLSQSDYKITRSKLLIINLRERYGDPETLTR